MLLAQVIYDVHQDFGLGHKVVATTTDNGANYVAAFKHFGVEDVPVEGDQEEEEEYLEEVVIGRPLDVHDQLEDRGEATLFELPKHHCRAAHTINLMTTVDIQKVNGWNSGSRCVSVMLLKSQLIIKDRLNPNSFVVFSIRARVLRRHVFNRL